MVCVFGGLEASRGEDRAAGPDDAREIHEGRAALEVAGETEEGDERVVGVCLNGEGVVRGLGEVADVVVERAGEEGVVAEEGRLPGAVAVEESVEADVLRERLDEVDPDSLTPREALALLYELKEL